MKTIVVNNPAARSGGALTILKQFLDNIEKYDTKNKYYVIVSIAELKEYEKENIKIIVIPQQGFKSRIIWDNLGLKKFLKEKKIIPDLFISFQNTGVNLSSKIPQIIYFHNALIVSKENWNVLKKEERLFWMYEKIYPFFIKQYLSRVKKVAVQTKWIKNEFGKKFNYSLDNIEIIKPEFNLPNIDKTKEKSKEKYRIFYPAAPIKFKNHNIIIEALSKLKDKEFECIFTFTKEDNLDLYNLIRNKKLESKIKLIGKISYEEVLEYYKSSDLVVLPSTIETFGLPLVEAASFGKSILVADKPYSREVIGKYEGATFIDIDNENKWVEEIEEKIKNKKEFNKFIVDYNSGWKDFFNLVN
jgi:glycosyltransferase involved in cell wall biosynthesis